MAIILLPAQPSRRRCTPSRRFKSNNKKVREGKPFRKRRQPEAGDVLLKTGVLSKTVGKEQKAKTRPRPGF